MNRPTKLLLILGVTAGVSLTASPALADEHCEYIDGTTSCSTTTVVESKENKNKTQTTTQYDSTTSFAGQTFQTTSTTETVTVKKNGSVTREGTSTNTYPVAGRTCESTYNVKTKDGQVKNGSSYDTVCNPPY